ncbi:MOSC domain-containing protein YiiM [Planctomycetales bacterium 10988]|nr:MOSC domain-containing protein YiiM [Planctomycetales bacterium 10988]
MSPLPRGFSKKLDIYAQVGRLVWIGLRTERRGPIEVVSQVEVTEEAGLIGDRFKGRPGSKRQITLIQAEHLPVVASLLNVPEVKPEQLRRNLVVSGINLLALKGERFFIGEAELEGTGPCPPCSRMEKTLGHGGYQAMRGHGGITARVLRGGTIHSLDPVTPTETTSEA